MSALIVESFSITRAAFLDGKTGAEATKLYGVRSGSVDIDIETYNNASDDVIVNTVNWFNMATISIESGFLPYDTMAAMYGSYVSSSGVGPNDYWSLPLWAGSSGITKTSPMMIRSLARKQDGTIGYFDLIFYKVQVGPLTFDGPTYKNGLSFSFTGDALMSDHDELGITLADPAVGRIRYSGRQLVVSSTSVIDNGDGTFTILTGDFQDNGDGTFTLNSDQVVDNGNGTYTISL